MKETAYLFQAALIGAWWVGLASSPTFFAAFQYKGIPPIAFWSFFAPDIILIAALSAVRAYRKEPALELIVLGAFGYASLYCCNASILTADGFLPTGLMVLGLFYNAFVCFSQSSFRRSTTGMSWNATKTLVQIVCMWALTLAVIPYLILDAFGIAKWPELGAASVAGSALFFGFGCLGLTSAYFMVRDGDGTPLPLDQTNHLVVSGPYRYIRNPMAVAGIGQGLAVAVVFQALPILVYSLLGAAVWHLVVRPAEEKDLINRFGESYLSYRRQVTCWLPTLRKIDV